MRVEEAVGARVREVREAKGMTQEQLGELLGMLLGKPWTRQSVYLAEKGQRAFTAAELLAIALVGTVSPLRLLMPPVNVTEIEFPGGHKISREELNRRALDDQDQQSIAGRIQHAADLLIKAHSELLSTEITVDRNLTVIGTVLDEVTQALLSFNPPKEPEA